MKKLLFSLIIFSLILCGCIPAGQTAQLAATTLPVYEFTTRLCEGTGITVTRLVTESVSCLHDYTLQVSQMRAIESAEAVIISGAGLEEFLDEALENANTVIDASENITLLCPEDEHSHEHEHEHEREEGHHHDNDPHIWLSPEKAKVMCRNICSGLTALYPQHRETFEANLTDLLTELDELQTYGEALLVNLSNCELITFHDGFGYLADSFGLTIAKAVEEESGSEASAAELIQLIEMVGEHNLPAIFTETNGSVSAAYIISAETGAAVYTLDMAMAGNSYFDAMYHNIDTLKEALG